MFGLILLGAGTSLAPSAAIAAAPIVLVVPTPPQRAPSMMSAKQITEHNQTLTKAHPYFIRCEKVDTIGSLVRTKRACKTNEDWARDSDQSNREARDSVQSVASGSNSGN